MVERAKAICTEGEVVLHKWTLCAIARTHTAMGHFSCVGTML